jgi:hypothetical protein
MVGFSLYKPMWDARCSITVKWKTKNYHLCFLYLFIIFLKFIVYILNFILLTNNNLHSRSFCNLFYFIFTKL